MEGDHAVLARTPDLLELAGSVEVPDAYLVACAERTGVGRIASFDRSIDRVGTVTRIEPAA